MTFAPYDISKINAGVFLLQQESAGCKMQMIQDGNFANSLEKPLRITGSGDSVRVSLDFHKHVLCGWVVAHETQVTGFAVPVTYNSVL